MQRFLGFVALLSAQLETAKALSRETVELPLASAEEFIKNWNEANGEAVSASFNAEGLVKSEGGEPTSVSNEGVSAAPLGGSFPADLTATVDSETGSLATGASVAASAIADITAGVNRLRVAHGLPPIETK